MDAVATARWQIGALVSFAGLLPPTPVSAKSAQTPVLLIHGKDDRTIPAAASTMAAAQFRKAGFTVELVTEHGVGHTISNSGAQTALRFLKEAFSGRSETVEWGVSLAEAGGTGRRIWSMMLHLTRRILRHAKGFAGRLVANTIWRYEFFYRNCYER